MAIPRPRVANFDLLHKKKLRTEAENFSPRLDHSGGIFSGLNRIDDKIAYCIKIVEDTLRDGRLEKHEVVGSKNHWKTKEYNPRLVRMGHTLSGSNADPFSDHSCEPIFYRILIF